MSHFNPLQFEPEILAYWNEGQIHKKANEQNKGGKPFSFLDGPPYTSGKVHIGTAWNKSLKDAILRYKRMRGFRVLDRAGYDMHGLPIENATEKKLGLRHKGDIQKIGVEKFVMECKTLCVENMHMMNEDFRRMGVWMDFDNPYQSITRDFISGEWWLVKRAHEQGRLYEGARAMAWDWKHQTSLAKHELEYADKKDTSLYVKMRLKEEDDTYLIIWTTTPWTIAFNLGIMANPNVTYVKCKVGSEQWIVAKDRAQAFISGVAKEQFEMIAEMKGSDLAGKEYIHPFQKDLSEHYDALKKSHSNIHTVVLSAEYVDTSSGSGLVHMAPGCGPEDYEVGYRNHIPAWNLVNEDGRYSEAMGPFAGKHAANDNPYFIEELEARGAVVGKETIMHSYPHGQRSHAPVIFRTTAQWFFKVEDLKGQLIAENDKIQWNPKAGYNAFSSWLENLRDNSISKQRYWGTPLPIWRNKDDPSDYIVVESVEELEALSGQKVPEPHIPWIDAITIKKDGKEYARVPDVLDVWVDAGTASWNALNYPRQEDLFKENFPADFILEGKDQVRGWFNLLHIASVIAFGKASFKAAYMHGFIQDAQGRKMSKSLGNYIVPEEVISKFGADTLRYYLIGGAGAGLDLNYNFEDMKVRSRNLMVLWNLHKFVLEMAGLLGMNPAQEELSNCALDMEEKYILSRMHSTIKNATTLFDSYRLDEVPGCIESLFLDLSRTYVQLTREKSATGSEEEKKAVLMAAYTVLMESLALFAPIAPFTTEKIYLEMRRAFSLETESVHLLAYPSCDESQIDANLESQMAIAYQVIQAGLASREKIKMGVRWPLKEMVIATEDSHIASAIASMDDVIRTQLNVKEISIVTHLEGLKSTVKPNYSTLNPDFKEDTAKIIAQFAITSPESVLAHIENKGSFAMQASGKEFIIEKKHLSVSYEAPPMYEAGSLKGAATYLNKTTTDELEAEGFARELMRRVQALRKKAGLVKQDRIALTVVSDEGLLGLLKEWEGAIAEKVGADECIVASSALASAEHASEEDIKGRKFMVQFSITQKAKVQ